MLLLEAEVFSRLEEMQTSNTKLGISNQWPPEVIMSSHIAIEKLPEVISDLHNGMPVHLSQVWIGNETTEPLSSFTSYK